MKSGLGLGADLGHDGLHSLLRVAQDEGQHKKRIPLLVTNGFAMGFLVFHPYYANSFEFRDDGEVTVDGNHPLAGKALRRACSE